MIMTGPCGWTIDKCGCGDGDGACWTSHSPAVRARATALTTHLMWAATGRRYGLCEVSVLPCSPPPPLPLYRTYPVASGAAYDPFGGPGARVSLIDGQWHNNGCGSGCNCTAACEVALPGPVDSIVSVMVDGVTVPSGAYEVHDARLLVRLDGDCWPTCQALGTAIPGFQAIYLLGLRIPAGIQAATETLACQFAAACAGGDCQLPGRVASMSRSGVDITLADIPTEGGKLRTGIQEVDDVIAADNPHGLTAPPQVMSPDMPRSPRTVTWAASS